MQLPEHVTINQVQGALVADWEMKPANSSSHSSNLSSNPPASSSPAKPPCPATAKWIFLFFALPARNATPRHSR